MKCNRCGYRSVESKKVCPVCGMLVENNLQDFAANYGNGHTTQGGVSSKSNNIIQTQRMQTYNQDTQNPAIGMKWFNYLIYFQLFLSMVYGIYYGFKIMLGGHYGVSDAELSYIYLFFHGLRQLDMAFGMFEILLAIFSLYVRFMLAGYKKNGPLIYIGYLMANFISMIVYSIGVINIVPEMASIYLSNVGTSLVAYFIIIVSNIVYFKKRRHLFTN